MSNLFKISLCMITTLSFVSCNDIESFQEMHSEENDVMTNLIKEFRADLPTNSRAESDFQILSVDTKSYEIQNDTVIETVSTRGEDNMFELSTVKIRTDKGTGFTILSTDSRLDKVYYYTENGNVSDTTNIAPLKEYIEMLPMVAANDITNPALPTSESSLNLLIGPIVPYKWGQGGPFNNLTPNCTCGECSNGHMPIGCVPTATAQTIATIGAFKSTFYGSKNINFKLLPASSYMMSAKQRQQVSHFFYEIALGCQTHFKCGGSPTTIKAACHYLRDIGYTCSYVEDWINVSLLTTELRNGFPHLIAGSNGEEGHMWIIDGIKKVGSTTYFSCNWGWNGLGDGWLVGTPYESHPVGGVKYSFNKNIRNIYIHSKPNN